MKVVVQRVGSAKVEVGGEVVGQIGRGILVLWGIEDSDTWTEADYLIRKVLNMKLWSEFAEDEDSCRASGTRVNVTEGAGKTWAKSVMDLDYEVLIVSQFTLMGTLKKGNKPDFHAAMKPELSKEFYLKIVDKLKAMYKQDKIQTGAFGHFMQVSLLNDGPVTITLEQKNNNIKTVSSPEISS